MDWSKAKTIVIIALIATDLILGGFLVRYHLLDVNAEKQAAASAAEYLESRGVSMDCEIPATVMKLPVLFVDFEEGEGGKPLTYKGFPLQVTNGGDYSPRTLEPGDQKASICGAAAAVIRTVANNDAIREIREIRLVYRVDRSGYTEAGEDTAFPAWYIDTDAGIFYIEALN